MSRITSLLIRFTQGLDANSSTVEYVRVKSSNTSENSAVEIEISNGIGGAWPRIASLIHEVGFRSGDTISFNDYKNIEISSDILVKLEENIKNLNKLTIRFANENSVHPGQLVSELRKHTIFGIPRNLYKNFKINSMKIYVGANQFPLNLSIDYTNLSDVRSMNGYPYLVSENETGKVDFIYLNSSNCYKKQQLPVEKYIHHDILKDLKRYKHTVGFGISIFCFIPEEYFKSDTPLNDWPELIDSINSKAKLSLEKMLQNQVAAIEKRILAISTRKKVYFKGEELGLVPINEQETVILYERYIAKNNNVFGKVSRLRLLDYSPKGIDSVCSFALNSNQPTTNVAVEFEYVLQNFFDHGHDPQQVRLILCYSMKKTIFPYDHFGVIFDIDRKGDLPKLVNKNTGSTCYVFALDEVLEER